jgi:glycerol-3-phosphate dehydrogenase
MSDLSRRHTLIEGDGGLVTITGGKLTTYRRMAADVVDVLCARDGSKARCRTDEIPLGSSRPLATLQDDAIEAGAAVSVDAETCRLLVRQQGERAPDVLGLVAGDRTLRERVTPAAAHILAEVVYAAREEGAATLDDVFSRRMRVSLRSRDAGLPMAPLAARLLARETGRDEAWADRQVSAYVDAVRRERGVLAGTLDAALAATR